jgi:sugar fermentation stimulation protein A
LVRRYKRFLADIENEHGIETVHCPNTGAMSGCSAPGSEVWYSRSCDERRKYSATLELVRAPDGALVGVNTLRANALVEEALASGVVTELRDFTERRREVADRELGARFDFVLSHVARRCVLEVKSVTLCDGARGLFPDAQSERARRHVGALEARCRAGDEAALLFCVQHTGARSVSPADEVDRRYGEALRKAHAAGVKVLAYAAELNAREFVLKGPLPVLL